MDATLRFGCRNALHTMHAALVLEPLVNVLAGHGENDFLEAAEIGRAGIERLNLPPHLFGVTEIHPVKIGGKQRGFGTARAGANFDDGIARVSRVRREHAALHLKRKAFLVLFELREFCLRHLRHLGLGGLRFNQRTVVRELRLALEQGISHRDELFEPRVFFRERLRLLRILERLGITQGSFDFRETAREAVDMGAEVHLSNE